MKKIFWCLGCCLNLLSLTVQSSRLLATTILEPVKVDSPRGDVPLREVGTSIPEGIPLQQGKGQVMAQQAPIPATTLEDRVTSVSELRDVQPTDWAFQALRSLIERYQISINYPDATFRGNRAMTRYEYAAALNMALDRINELIEVGLSTQMSREDLLVWQRLQDEFAGELAFLRGRIDSLEVRTAQLEANQFSTTTTLNGWILFAATEGGFTGDRLIDPTGALITNDDPQATVVARATFDLDTSFSGTDLLKMRIEGGTGGVNDNAAGVLEPNFGSIIDYSIKPPTDGEFVLGRMYYSFLPLKDLRVDIGPGIVATDYVDTNTYANICFFDFSTLALINNYILFPVFGFGGGAVIRWNPGDGPFTLRTLYLAPGANDPGEGTIGFGLAAFTELLYPGEEGELGLFGDFDQSMVELEFAPSTNFVLRLQYSGGELFDKRFDVFGANLELTLGQKLGIFGRYGYGSYDETVYGDIKPNYWMAGFSLRDLFRSGDFASIAAVQPFIANELGNATQTNWEALYNFPFNDHIRLTPTVQVITNSSNQDDNDTIVTGTLRMVFSF